MTIHLIFVPGMIATLWTSHFLSYVKLDAEPTGQLAVFISANMGTFDAIALVGALLLATTTLLRLGKDDWKWPVARLGAIALSPMVVETLAYSVQDGTTNDLERVGIHSLILLALIISFPLVCCLVDLWRLKNPRLATAADSQFAESKTIESYKRRARSASERQNS